MMLTFAGVFLAVVNIQISTALRWTSVGDLPANSTVQACVGDNVTLLWKYDTDSAEHVVDVEWQFQPKGQAEVTIASYIRGSFLVSPATVQHVHFVPNAGLQVVHVIQQDSGIYSVRTNVNLHGSIVDHSQRVLMEVSDAPSTSDGALHVQLMPGAVQNSVTGEWHVRLSCGTFTKLGQPPVSVVWTTPANETIPSSYYDDLSNKYILVVDNPVASGQYTCRLERTPSEMCLAVDSPLRHGASVHVDGAEARLSVCSAQLSELKSENANLTDQLSELTSESHQPRDCQDVQQYDRFSAVHTVYVSNVTIEVYCDQETDGGGWTVIQRREDGSVDFYRGWREYERGFGNVTGEFWLGLSNIYRLTNSGNYSLRVDLQDFNGTQIYAVYDNFRIDGANQNYTLHLSGYHGNAGDSMTADTGGDLNNHPFSTYDHDNDASSGNCASHWHGAWWYNLCMYSNLNGLYTHNSNDRHPKYVIWVEWNQDARSFKRAEMKIRLRA